MNDALGHRACLVYARTHGNLRKWRNLVKTRGIFYYWQESMAITAHAPNGVGRKRDLAAYQADFDVLKRQERDAWRAYQPSRR